MKNELLKLGLAVALSFSAINSYAEKLYGLTANNQLFVMADASTPSAITTPASVSGVTSGQTLVAIDFNPADGKLYALGYNTVNGDAQLYTINTSGSAYTATAVNTTPMTLQLGNAQSVGLDFNAMTDNQATVVGNNGNSYALDANTGLMIGTVGTVTYAPGDINSGATAAVSTNAYTNSFFGSDGSTQLGYDLNNNLLVSFDADVPNTVHTTGLTGLALSPGTAVGMDSYFDPLARENKTYLAAEALLSSGASLYNVNEQTGLAVNIGAIGSGNLDVRDIAVEVDREVPANVSGDLMAGLTLNQRNIVLFDSDDPGVIRDVVEINGVANGQTVVALDTRPADGKLYAMAYNNTNATYQLYTIDLSTGTATAVNATPASLNLGSSADLKAGFDFDPVTDRIRVTGTNGLNAELSPTSGLVLSTGNNLNFATGDVNVGATANVGTIAHTNNYTGATATQTIGIDLGTGAMVNVASGASGSLNTILNLGSILGTGGNTNASLDIQSNTAAGTNTGYLVSNSGTGDGLHATLYVMDPSDGSTDEEGSVGPAIGMQDIAVASAADPVSVHNVASAQQFPSILLYPNPVIDHAYIILPYTLDNMTHIYVFDINGRIIHSSAYTPGGNKMDVDLSGLPAGYYNLRVLEEGQIPQNLKILKQ